MRIGEFSKASGVSVKTLRYYDAIGLFQPADKDPLTRYRAYRTEQLHELAAILALRELGLTLDEIKCAMRQPSMRRTLLERAAASLRESIDANSRTLRWLESVIPSAVEGSPDSGHASTSLGMTPVVVLRHRPEIAVAAIRATLGESRDIAELERELLSLVPHSCRGAMRGSLWHQCNETTGVIDAEHFVEIVRNPPRRPGLTVRRLPAVTAACAYSDDSEDDARRAFADVRRWMSTRGYELAGAKRELYWSGRLAIEFPISSHTPLHP